MTVRDVSAGAIASFGSFSSAISTIGLASKCLTSRRFASERPGMACSLGVSNARAATITTCHISWCPWISHARGSLPNSSAMTFDATPPSAASYCSHWQGRCADSMKHLPWSSILSPDFSVAPRLLLEPLLQVGQFRKRGVPVCLAEHAHAVINAICAQRTGANCSSRVLFAVVFWAGARVGANCAEAWVDCRLCKRSLRSVWCGVGAGLLALRPQPAVDGVSARGFTRRASPLAARVGCPMRIQKGRVCPW